MKFAKNSDNTARGEREGVVERELLAADVESIDHEVASTAWEKTRLCRRCGVA